MTLRKNAPNGGRQRVHGPRNSTEPSFSRYYVFPDNEDDYRQPERAHGYEKMSLFCEHHDSSSFFIA
jgi:hypothetical protein